MKEKLTMSDDIVEVQTSYADVAALGDGYIDRVDGERILLALPFFANEGDVVRFIVHLVDGTAAFAGSGRCVQVSDQGVGVPEAERFETLIDSLAFDDRSRPVYDYIVAVRNAAYADAAALEAAEATEAAAANASPDQEARYEATGEDNTAIYPPDDPLFASAILAATRAAVSTTRAANAQAAAPVAQAPRAASAAPVQEAAVAALAAVEVDPLGSLMTPLPAPIAARSVPENAVEPMAAVPVPVPAPVPVRVAAGPVAVASREFDEPAAPVQVIAPTYASVAPAPLPTGILTRAASAGHWVPTAVRPAPRSAPSKLFGTKPGVLDIPAAPPRPDLDRSRWVERAPSPGR
jgi:hypothetical protein